MNDINNNWESALAEITFLRTYSQYNNGVHETWTDVIQRYINHLRDVVLKDIKISAEIEDVLGRIQNAITKKEILPSMRLLQFSGKVATKFPEAAFNCSFVCVKSIDSISEIIYLLMCGCGVGFSIENKYISKIPPKTDFGKDVVIKIKVKDSTESWIRAIGATIKAAMMGSRLEYDLSKVRPAGAKITNRGWSIGSQGLYRMLDWLQNFIAEIPMGNISSINIYDIITGLSFYISMSSTRRTALLSLSDAGDKEMAGAKVGEFWNTHPWRSTCNNSAIFYEKPKWVDLCSEIDQIKNSGTGERGIFVYNKHLPRDRIIEEEGINPCGEIILNDCQFCNLSEIIARHDDTEDTLMNKAKLAAVVGTIQSMITNFNHEILNPKWFINTQRERLIGVSITGISDCPTIQNNSGLLRRLREKVIETNKKYAKMLGIPVAAACTTIKPSGSASAVTNCSSGIHPRYAEYYIRRVRISNDSPLLKKMKGINLPIEDDQVVPNQSIMCFGIKSPDGSITINNTNLENQLKQWLDFKKNYTEHSVSVSLYVKPDEWDVLKLWIWENWEYIAGMSFFPYIDHKYLQAPFEKCDKDTYEKLQLAWNSVDRSDLYTDDSFEDNTSGCDKSSY